VQDEGCGCGSSRQAASGQSHYLAEYNRKILFMCNAARLQQIKPNSTANSILNLAIGPIAGWWLRRAETPATRLGQCSAQWLSPPA